MTSIQVADQQTTLSVDVALLKRAARLILKDHGPEVAHVSIAVVDDPTIHELNRRYLEHDYPTDVLSFVLERSAKRLEGEVVVSADTAADRAAEYGWEPHDELLLYVIHGILHLVGFRDKDPPQRKQMRGAERHYVELCGVRWPDADAPHKAARPERPARGAPARRAPRRKKKKS